MRTTIRQLVYPFIAIVFLVAVPGRAVDAEPALCPGTYFFNDVEWVSTEENNHSYLFSFTLEFGTTVSLIPGAGRYDFQEVTADNLLAVLTGVYMLTTCNRILVPIPPYAEPQPLLIIQETDWAYSRLILLFQPPPEDSDECFSNAESVFTSDETGRPGRLGEQLRRNVIDCSGGGGGASDGGGDEAAETTVYCLYYDYYDEDGNFLYEELQFCWEESE